MCCRVVVDITKETREMILKDLTIEDPNQIDLFTSYNLSPGQFLPLIHKDTAIVMSEMMWGYLPLWSNKSQILPNARVESIATKPTFKDSFEKRRCLLPVKGYYEWYGTKGNRVPYYFYHETGEVLALACLFEETKDKEGKEIVRFTVITREAIEPFSTVHHRMPLIIEPKYWERWIDCSKPLKADPSSMTINYGETLRFHRVSPEVNKTTNDKPTLIEPYEESTLF